MHRLVFAVVLVAGLALSSCNFPSRERNQQAPSNDLIVTVRVATEVRTGPGQVYDVVGVLNPGQQVEAVGQSPNGDYLLVRDPSNPEVLGWLINNSSTVTRYPIGLPISTPPHTPTVVAVPEGAGTCPTPVGGGPTPVSCVTPVGDPSSGAGCPTPVGGGPTPVSCSYPTVPSPSDVGCPTPVGGGPTPVSCSYPTVPSPSDGGCPTPVGGGPTPVSCSYPTSPSSSDGGCPTPVGGGPTPVSCSYPAGPSIPAQGPTAVPTLVR